MSWIDEVLIEGCEISEPCEVYILVHAEVQLGKWFVQDQGEVVKLLHVTYTRQDMICHQSLLLDFGCYTAKTGILISLLDYCFYS